VDSPFCFVCIFYSTFATLLAVYETLVANVNCFLTSRPFSLRSICSSYLLVLCVAIVGATLSCLSVYPRLLSAWPSPPSRGIPGPAPLGSRLGHGAELPLPLPAFLFRADFLQSAWASVLSLLPRLLHQGLPPSSITASWLTPSVTHLPPSCSFLHSSPLPYLPRHLPQTRALH
jgi:hypothetical protein